MSCVSCRRVEVRERREGGPVLGFLPPEVRGSWWAVLIILGVIVLLFWGGRRG